jgi:hypothetical protein
VLYVEITDANNRPVLQTKIPLENGIGNGSIYIPQTITSGTHNFRAYTAWMKNFDSAFYFQKEINVFNPDRYSTTEQNELEKNVDIQFFPEGVLLELLTNLERGSNSQVRSLTAKTSRSQNLNL